MTNTDREREKSANTHNSLRTYGYFHDRKIDPCARHQGNNRYGQLAMVVSLIVLGMN